MSISLRDVTKDNWLECTKLQVAPEQQHFVATNVFSIAESRFYPSFHPQAIYHNEEMVGFVMWGTDPDDGRTWIPRLMIDQRFQGKGYGRGAMETLIGVLREDPACPAVYLSFEPENSVGERLYESLGFRRTGDVESGEIVMCLRFDRTGAAADATPDNSPPQ